MSAERDQERVIEALEKIANGVDAMVTVLDNIETKLNQMLNSGRL